MRWKLCEALILMGCDLGLQGWKLQGLAQISGDLWFRMTFYDSQYVFNCLCDTWFQALGHIKLHLPLAYHGMEVINNKVFTIAGYSDKAPEV